MFLRKVSQSHYGELVNDLHNQHTRGASQYPEASAYTMVYQFRPNRPVTSGTPAVGTPTQLQSCIPGTVQSNFVGAQYLQQHTDLVAGTDNRLYSEILCYNCDQPGHYGNKCPKPDTRIAERAARERVQVPLAALTA